ncbi:MAG: hypothetical protein ACYTXC_19030 [Nostoc sp.]
MFQGTEPIKSVIFSMLDLTTDLVLAAGKVLKFNVLKVAIADDLYG